MWDVRTATDAVGRDVEVCLDLDLQPTQVPYRDARTKYGVRPAMDPHKIRYAKTVENQGVAGGPGSCTNRGQATQQARRDAGRRKETP